ncbi:MAG: STAS domain-containing protein [bacterium]
MKIKSREQDGVVIVQPHGAIALTSHLTLKKKVRSLAEDGHRRILIDMASVTDIDSTGVGTLVSLLNTVRSRGGDLRLAGKIHPDVLNILNLCGLNRVFVYYADAETGTKSFTLNA